MDHTVIIKKYANRRLYDTEKSVYVTLAQLADYIHEGLMGDHPKTGAEFHELIDRQLEAAKYLINSLQVFVSPSQLQNTHPLPRQAR